MFFVNIHIDTYARSLCNIFTEMSLVISQSQNTMSMITIYSWAHGNQFCVFFFFLNTYCQLYCKSTLFTDVIQLKVGFRSVQVFYCFNESRRWLYSIYQYILRFIVPFITALHVLEYFVICEWNQRRMRTDFRGNRSRLNSSGIHSPLTHTIDWTTVLL